VSHGSRAAFLALLAGACADHRAAAPPLAIDMAAPPGDFQPAFHQALRRSVSTDGDVTLRYRLPLGRGGARARVSFVSGNGPLAIYAAAIARAGDAPAALTFAGQPGIALPAWQRAHSDEVALALAAGDEVDVTFAAAGALAASGIANFPDSTAHAGRDLGARGGTPNGRLAGVATVEVAGGRARAAVAVGDSITEGYVGGHTFFGPALADSFGYVPVDDVRNAWPAIAARALGAPVANAGVSGSGTEETLDRFDAEIGVLAGELTDCVVLLGTNDIGVNGAGLTFDQISSNLAALYARLAPLCRVWAGTLLPKEWIPSANTAAEYVVLSQSRRAVNAWIRARTAADHVAGVIDFERVTRASDADPDHFGVDADGQSLGEDGIHPSIAGQRAMGIEAARVLGASGGP
jgi:lysophospholipase L1-like esterase